MDCAFVIKQNKYENYFILKSCIGNAHYEIKWKKPEATLSAQQVSIDCV